MSTGQSQKAFGTGNRSRYSLRNALSYAVMGDLSGLSIPASALADVVMAGFSGNTASYAVCMSPVVGKLGKNQRSFVVSSIRDKGHLEEKVKACLLSGQANIFIPTQQIFSKICCRAGIV